MKSRGSVLPNERVRILGISKALRLEHSENRRIRGPSDGLDGTRGAFATRRVVIKGQHHGLETQPAQPHDRSGLSACTTDGGDVQEVVAPKTVDVHQSLDEHDLAPLGERQTE